MTPNDKSDDRAPTSPPQILSPDPNGGWRPVSAASAGGLEGWKPKMIRRPGEDDTREEANFRAAVRALSEPDLGKSLALGSLLASATGDERYSLIAREELAPRAGELDLHLTGQGVEGHSANAAAFGDFVKKIADSVKVVARERMGRQRMTSDLLVEPSPGSVRVLFRTPDPVRTGSLPTGGGGDDWTDPNRQTLALQEVATILANAEPDGPGSEVVDSLVENLPPKARPTLVNAVKAIAQEGWEVEGEFRQRGLGVQPIHLTHAGAIRLKIALEVKQRERADLTTTGVFDGLRRARNICWFIEDGTGREIAAVVPTPAVMADVANYSSDPDMRVTADFTVITTHGPGSSDSGSKSFILERIRPTPEAPTLDGA